MENRINIGELDTMVEILRMVQGRGSQGEKTWTASSYAHVWAKVDYSVAESVSDGNLEAGRTVQLTIYKIPELTSRWRVRIGDEAYEIRTIDTISRISPLCILTLNAIDG